MNAALKLCRTCGRGITPRAKWAGKFEEISYCSAACRSHKPGPIDARFESTILDMLRSRTSTAGQKATVTCEDVEATLALDPPIARQRERCRQAARRLAGKGVLEVVQDGKVVEDPSFAKGVMHLRLASAAQ